MEDVGTMKLRLEILLGSHSEHWKFEKELAQYVMDPNDRRRVEARKTSTEILAKVRDLEAKIKAAESKQKSTNKTQK